MQNYLLKNQTVTVGNTHYSIRSLKNKQQFYDHEQRAEELGICSASWSLFGVVWPASIILADTVSRLILDGKRVLEIGCGLALSSIVLHKRGIDVTASDYHPLAREFLDENILGNNLPPIKFETGNWNVDNPLLGEFDVIIGSDILYEPAHAENVSRFIDNHSGHEVKIIIVDPDRGNRSRFTRLMLTLGYTHHFEKFNVKQDDGSICKGRILHYQR